jgi:hypothetical protein
MCFDTGMSSSDLNTWCKAYNSHGSCNYYVVNFSCMWMLPVRDVEILPAWIGPRSGGYFEHWGKHTIDIVVWMESLQNFIFRWLCILLQFFANDQLDTLFISLFIIPVYMFQASQCSSSGDQIVLTFRVRASYCLGWHLNISALPEARASYTLGQPHPQPFKYFALNIFSEFSLIFSTTLKVLKLHVLTYLPVERKPHVSIFYMRLFVHNL